MSIMIDKEKCIGCRKCCDICPGSLISLDDSNKSYIKYPKDCWGCASCIKECQKHAISLYLGADIGGKSSKMTVDFNEDIVKWQVEKINKEVFTIEVNRKDSNKY